MDFILANSVDPDEMLHKVAFHLGLHCLPKYLFSGIQIEKGLFQVLAIIISSNLIGCRKRFLLQLNRLTGI